MISLNRDRANIKFADVESSGRADLIWVNKYTGAGSVFKNNGPVGNRNDNSDSWLGWTTRGVLYSPIGRGETMVSLIIRYLLGLVDTNPSVFSAALQ